MSMKEQTKIKVWQTITPEEYELYRRADVLEICFNVDGDEHVMTFKKKK